MKLKGLHRTSSMPVEKPNFFGPHEGKRRKDGSVDVQAEKDLAEFRARWWRIEEETEIEMDSYLRIRRPR